MSCPNMDVDPCAGVVADGVDRVLLTDPTGGPSTLGLENSIKLGMTRAQVTALALTDPEVQLLLGTSELGQLRVAYCAMRIRVAYLDTPDMNGTINLTFSDDDVVAQITTLPGFTGHTDTGLRLGGQRSAVDTAYTGQKATVGNTFTGGPYDIFPNQGVWVTSTRESGAPSDTITSIAIFPPTVGTPTAMPTPFNTSIDLRTFKVGTVTASLFGGTRFDSTAAVLGTPGVKVFATIGTVSLAVAAWPAMGVKAFAQKNNSLTLDAHKVQFIQLGVPFGGVDSNGLGIGSPQSLFESTFTPNGTKMFLGLTFHIYQTAASGFPVPEILVHFTEDLQCIPRADSILFPNPPIAF